MPASPSTTLAVAAILADWEAEKVKVPETPDVRERDEGETVIPAGKPGVDTVTVSLKPLGAETEICTVCAAPPWASVTLFGDREIVKPGECDAGGVGDDELPPPQPAITNSIIRVRYSAGRANVLVLPLES